MLFKLYCNGASFVYPCFGLDFVVCNVPRKKGTVRVTYALCNDCGNSWKVAQQDSENNKKTNTKFIGLLVFIILLFIFAVVFYFIGKNNRWF